MEGNLGRSKEPKAPRDVLSLPIVWERASLCFKQPGTKRAVPLRGPDFSTDAGGPQDAAHIDRHDCKSDNDDGMRCEVGAVRNDAGGTTASTVSTRIEPGVVFTVEAALHLRNTFQK
jgi:hypothetical protein